MTYGEILNRVVVFMFGTSEVDDDIVAILVGEEGLIANACRTIQQECNYWFMRMHTSFNTIADTQSYTLPTEIKEEILVQFLQDGETYFRPPLQKVRQTEAQHYQWIMNDATEEYPQYYEIFDEAIVFYAIPSEDDRECHITYWGFLGRPASFDGVGGAGDSVEDDITKYAHEAVVFRTLMDLCAMHDEINRAQYFGARYEDALFHLKEENRKRTVANFSPRYAGI